MKLSRSFINGVSVQKRNVMWVIKYGVSAVQDNYWFCGFWKTKKEAAAEARRRIKATMKVLQKALKELNKSYKEKK